MKNNLVAIRIVIIFIITLFNFVAHAQENRQSALDKVIEQMNAQNNRLQDTNSIFKSELIPAIEQELRKNNSSFDKLAKDMKSRFDFSNEKLSRLVDILKSFAIEQSKIDQDQKTIKSELIPAIEQELRKNNSSFDKLAKDMKSRFDLSNEKLSRLVDILKSFAIEQSKIDQDQKTILTNQQQIKATLADLRRKANVNINRTEDVIKKINR
jgi:hypothetical protein